MIPLITYIITRCDSFSIMKPSWSSGKTLGAKSRGLGFKSH